MCGPEQTPSTPPRCAQCGDVIGVYERLVYVSPGSVRRTSRAAEQGVSFSGEPCYHLTCYEPEGRTDQVS
jgi:hypothetical protein